jgi:hypothetical protein
MDISVAKVEPRQALASGAMLNRGRGYCADEWTGIAVVAVYISPNSGQAAFGDFLDEDGECVERCFPRQVLVLGNFNAHSTQSGNSATYTRGRWLTDWAAGLEHVLANKGTASTCVAWGGSSVVVVTWAISDLYERIRDWRVALGVATLSDHLYIFIEVIQEDVDKNNSRDARGGASRSGPSPLHRWRLMEWDRKMFRAAAIISAWSWDARGTTSLGSNEEVTTRCPPADLQHGSGAAGQGNWDAVPASGQRRRAVGIVPLLWRRRDVVNDNGGDNVVGAVRGATGHAGGASRGD